MENNPKPYFEKEFSYILSLYNNQEQNLEDIIEFHEFNLSGNIITFLS